jgi:3-dehydroquinate synthase
VAARDLSAVSITVPARPEGHYDVMIGAGLLDRVAGAVAEAAPAAAYALIAPTDVAQLHGGRVLRTLHAAGLRAELFTFASGEAHKTREVWAGLTDQMLHQQFGRDSVVIALGGGVTGDLAGFVAATYMRGIPVVQVPTSLLAMIDASVGGKTGVDTPAGKNLVGAFHAPALVVIDPLVLNTLPPEELRAGMAEAVKHGAILDAGYFDWIEQAADALLRLEPEAVERLVRRSVELKTAVVAEDPHEQGRRAILNFGHTIGHAIETRAHYSIVHGAAIAAGMVAEAGLGEALGVTAGGTRQRLIEVLTGFALPVESGRLSQDLIDLMRIDKKARNAEPRFVLLERIGAVARAADGGWLHAVGAAALQQVSAGTGEV